MIEDRGILEDTISLCHMRLIIYKYFPSSLIRMILVLKKFKNQTCNGIEKKRVIQTREVFPLTISLLINDYLMVIVIQNKRIANGNTCLVWKALLFFPLQKPSLRKILHNI